VKATKATNAGVLMQTSPLGRSGTHFLIAFSRPRFVAGNDFDSRLFPVVSGSAVATLKDDGKWVNQLVPAR
jgi:hypothetical protein